MIAPADYYGLPKLPTSAPPVPESHTAPADSSQTVGVLRKGLTQDPVLVLVGFLFLAFLLARAAEHGISLGFRVRA